VVGHWPKIQGNRKSEMDLVTRRRYNYDPKLAYRCRDAAYLHWVMARVKMV